MPAHDQGSLIAVDWGTTALRAYLLDAGGGVLARKETAEGILAAAGRFSEVLAAAVSHWLAPDRPILMSGMIGSRQGWIEAPYLTCPVDVRAIAERLVPLDAGVASRAWILPGLVTRDAEGIPDVMRGEETQVLGALETLRRRSGRFVLPGTHSKWVAVSEGRIEGFATYMTGEVFAALKEHTILGRLMVGDSIAPSGFARGLDAVKTDQGPPGRLLHRIFSARTLGLVDGLVPDEIAGYLSGLLIGSEIVAAVSGRGISETGAGSVVIVGNSGLAALYAGAVRRLGLSAEVAPPDCVTAGHIAVARAAHLV
jgi:2-dehydro-3-deoxygalactonokinase